MKHLKPYNESSVINNTESLLDCFQDMFDEIGFRRRELKDMPGYEGIISREKNSSRPYVIIDRSKGLSVPHDSIVLTTCVDRYTPANDIERMQILRNGDFSYFFAYENVDKINPGCHVALVDKSIRGGSYTKSEIYRFSCIEDNQLRKMMLDANERVISHLGIDNYTPHSVISKGRFDIGYYYKSYKFERSWLMQKRHLLKPDEFEKLMKDAI